MSKDRQFCDHCGNPLDDTHFRAYAEVPINLLSANKGESAVVCSQCEKLISQCEVRPTVSKAFINAVFDDIRDNLKLRMQQHGKGVYASDSEAIGVITKEYHELIEAEHARDRVRTYAEANDIAVGCIWLMASYRMKGTMLG